MPLEPITEFPYDFHGYKLLKRLGAGYISEVYLAEVSEEVKNVPRLICLKIFTDKSHLEPGAYTVETATEEFVYQRKVLKEVQHTFIVKGFPEVLPDVKDCLPTDLGLCNLDDLQKTVGDETEPRGNHFHPIAVKYFAAQIFLAVAHLHSKGIFWDDAKATNVMVRSDFTLRLIDIGFLYKRSDSGVRDHYFLAGSLHNMSTTSKEEFSYQDLQYYQTLFKRSEQEVDPVFQDLLNSLLKLESFDSLLHHPYWTNILEENPDTSINLSVIKSNEVVHLTKLRECAWATLRPEAQAWILDRGLDPNLHELPAGHASVQSL